ncbi:hypothetical protein OF83DRAFT_834522 [Amylostereum chailletii]|nr:hypothetical protein OF83DRAFT_834522 [Amylostereum chailletii]
MSVWVGSTGLGSSVSASPRRPSPSPRARARARRKVRGALGLGGMISILEVEFKRKRKEKIVQKHKRELLRTGGCRLPIQIAFICFECISRGLGRYHPSRGTRICGDEACWEDLRDGVRCDGVQVGRQAGYVGQYVCVRQSPVTLPPSPPIPQRRSVRVCGRGEPRRTSGPERACYTPTSEKGKGTKKRSPSARFIPPVSRAPDVVALLTGRQGLTGGDQRAGGVSRQK